MGKETAMSLSAHMDVLVTAPSPHAEGSGTSTSFTLMHTSQLLMTMVVEALPRTPTTKDGLRTWAIATYQPLLQLDQPQKQYHQQNATKMRQSFLTVILMAMRV